MFWREYEEKINEKVLARSLGRYISGWNEFDSIGLTSMWGLVIATTGGFRFHHFPQQSWLGFLIRFTGQEEPKERTFFVPKENIVSARLIRETKWWRKILKSAPPHLIVSYRDEAGNEQQLILETDFTPNDLADHLTALTAGKESIPQSDPAPEM